MKEWYSDIMDTYWPEIEAELKGEPVVFRFVGLFEGYGKRVSGLFVVTEKTIYVRGKPKVGAFTPMYKLGGAKKVFKVPLAAVFEYYQKKTKFAIKFTLDWMGPKYTGKKDKVVIAVYQGKDGKVKEPKDEWMNRIAELNSFLASHTST